MKSTVTKPKQPSETQDKDSGKKKEDSEKKVLQDKPHCWIEACVKRLDPGGYPGGSAVFKVLQKECS